MRRPLLARVLTVVGAGGTVLALAACSDPVEADRALTEQIFLETCAPGGGTELEQDVCECAFERITDDLSAAEIERLDRNLRDEPDTVPPEVTEAALDCAAEPLSP